MYLKLSNSFSLSMDVKLSNSFSLSTSTTVPSPNSIFLTRPLWHSLRFLQLWQPKRLVLCAQASFSSDAGFAEKGKKEIRHLPNACSIDNSVLSKWEDKLKTNRLDYSGAVTLDRARNFLIRLEDTIIFCLFERAQYLSNAGSYDPKAFSLNGFQGSLVEFMVKQTEHLHKSVGRYQSPDEHPFYPQVSPNANLPADLNYPQAVNACVKPININQKIWDMYFINLIPKLVKEGDDGNYGATVACDSSCLQAISKRIHFGNCVAEAKFRASPSTYEPAIRAQDSETILALLTDENVEIAVKNRVEKKTRTYGQEIRLNGKIVGNDPVYKIQPNLVVDLYGDWIMPLTKEVQVQYLLARLS